MSGPTLADVTLLLPELVLVGAALLLLPAARRIRDRGIASVITIVAALAAAALSARAWSWGTQVGFGEMLTLDAYSQFFKLLIAATLVAVVLLSVAGRAGGGVPRGEYHAMLLLAATGMMIAASAADLVPLYLCLELVTLCSYILVGIRVERGAANEAAVKYFLLGSFASALLLFGISLTYGLAGTTSYEGIAAAMADPARSQALVAVAIVLVTTGLTFKIAAVPFHAWAPDAYQGASAPVAGFLAAGSKAAGLAALGRVFLVAFGPESAVVSVLLVGLATLSLLAGSVMAVPQTDMKRLLAYSSIAHAGYAVLGLVAGTPEGVSATMVYAFFYAFMTLGAFGVLVALGERGETLEGFAGLAAQRPGTAAVMLLFLLSLTGIPPTAGFAAKFIVISAAVRAGQVVLAVLAVGCSVITAFVYMRVAVLMYMGEAEEPVPPRLPVAISATLVVAALITLLGGILPGALATWAVSP